VVVFEDDVVERWTPVGKHYVVQFWFRFAVSDRNPVLRFAERAP